MSVAPDPVSYWSDELLPVGPCKRKLARLWLILGIAVLGLLLVRSMVGERGAYGDDTSAVWSWFLPNVIPTLMLIAGILVVDDAKRRGREEGEEAKPEPEASGFLYRTAFLLSVLHLGGLFGLIVYEAVSTPRMTDLTQVVGYFSAPLQGLIAAFLGAFFSK